VVGNNVAGHMWPKRRAGSLASMAARP